MFGLESSSLTGSIDGFIEMLIRSPTSSKMRPPDDRARNNGPSCTFNMIYTAATNSMSCPLPQD